MRDKYACELVGHPVRTDFVALMGVLGKNDLYINVVVKVKVMVYSLVSLVLG